MKFEYIPKTCAQDVFGYIESECKFYSFVEEFNIISVHWSEPMMISASYLLRLLEKGTSAKARGVGRGNSLKNDEHSSDLIDFYLPLFDHSAMWKMNNGNVICTAMPYGDEDSILNSFYDMVHKYNYPETIHLDFLEDKYRYRPNGDYMILIYCDESQDEFNPNYSDEEVRKRAFRNSAPSSMRYQNLNNTYVRDRYVSEYAKRRAHGKCQLCGTEAPFKDRYGRPYLETHHVIWLADGGEDSVNNVVALCPNCHRKMHSLNLEEDVYALSQVASLMN